jgi:hypothetical protein
MWKLHTPVLLVGVAALFLGLSGSSLISGSVLDRWLTDLDIWLQGWMSYPTVGAFGLGVLLAYIVYGVFVLGRQYRVLKALARLTELWTEGVAIRKDGLDLATDAQVTAWVERRYAGWHNRVIDVLEGYEPVDAQMFATVVEHGAKDQGLTFRSPYHRTYVLTLTQELETLKTIIERQQARMSPVLSASLLRLSQASPGTFPKAQRARQTQGSGNSAA